MQKIIAYLIAAFLFFPTILILLLAIGLTISNYGVATGFNQFFNTPIAWITLAASAHLGAILSNPIARNRLASADFQQLVLLQNIIAVSLYILCMIIGLFKLANT